MNTLSINETFAGRTLLVTGASGFVGKVWLSMMLARVPEIRHIYVVLRGKGRSVRERFERMVESSPAFKPLHDEHGEKLAHFLRGRITLLEGDVSRPNLGIDDITARRLRKEVDVLVNFAGLVDFNPDLRDALDSNVRGLVHVADFVQACDHAGLVHVSTCYVAGQREGFIDETIVAHSTPNGRPFDPVQEHHLLEVAIEETVRAHDEPEVHDEIRDLVVTRLRERGDEGKESRIRAMCQRLHRRRLKEALIDLGTQRALERGWPNTYTYTKAMAESLLAARGNKLAWTIIRPAIVESAIAFPFPGWNEGFNTSGPLVYLAGTWLRHIPARPEIALDVIPVDLVCNGLTIAAAALMRGEQAPVYHCGTSDLNRLSMERIFELSSLAHRKHLRTKGATRLRRLVLSRWDIVHTHPEDVLNVGNIRGLVHQTTRFLRHGLPRRIPGEVREKADDIAKSTENGERRLRQIEDVLALFQPFIHDHDFVFECRALLKHKVVEADFCFEPRAIEWRPYWMDIHMPGLRRWCFPEYEGKEHEVYRPPHPFRLLPENHDVAAGRQGVG